MNTILAVDDDNVNLSTLRGILSEKYKVIPVKKGTQALSYLENGDCDVILLDVNMPDIDGFEVLRRIRQIKKHRQTPVIFLTGDNNSDTETRCFDEGAVDFIGRPFVPAVMLSRIARVLELSELRKKLADRLEQKVREVSDTKSKIHRDLLTGLWNRDYTEDAVNSMLKLGLLGSLLMIDIDNFKRINDEFGHIEGDKTLKTAADVMRENSVDGDVLCRIGGDEFVMFIKDKTDKSELRDKANAILDGIKAKAGEGKFAATVSIGIATVPEDGSEFSKLVNAADKALYYVKQNGKDACHFFSSKNAAEPARKAVDLEHLTELMNSADKGKGAYQLDFEGFNSVYNFIQRFVERSGRDVQTVLFTISENPNANPDPAEAEQAMKLLEQSIVSSLRRSDISTRYSNRQMIVILMDANSVNGDMVAERVINDFNRLYTGDNIRVEYGVTGLANRGKK